MAYQLIFSLKTSFLMFWEVLWPLVLGFTLSAAVQTFVSHSSMEKILGKDNIKSYTLASLLGAASSSCSYAAVAISRSIFRKGATFASSMIFELSSTNLVIELGIILIVLMGWQFALSEFIGGIIMIIIIALIFRFTLTKKLVEKAKIQAEKGLVGKMESHASMSMNDKNLTSLTHYFIMDWTAVWKDILIGFLIAGFLAVFIPASFWQAFFFKNDPTIAFIEGPLIGPLVAIFSFVCSVGNVPLAAVLWNGGISFGGVVSFIFADLIVLPILNIYRKYYGLKTTIYIFVTFYIAMVLAGYFVEILFKALNIIPAQRNLEILNSAVGLNYTFFLNVLSLIILFFFIIKFIKTGGMEMLKMMNHEHHH